MKCCIAFTTVVRLRHLARMVDAYESKEGKDGKTGLKEGGFRLSILKIVVLLAVFLCVANLQV